VMKQHLFQVCLVFMVLLGLTLEATAGVATVVPFIRIKPQDDKTELVFDLKGQPTDIQVDQKDPKKISVQFTGALAGILSSHSLAIPDQKVAKSVYVEQKDNKVQLFIQRDKKTSISVYALQSPDRLVISVNEFQDNTASAHIAPGVIHRRIVSQSGHGPLNINIIDVDLSNPLISIEPVLATNEMHGKARVSRLVNLYNAVAGINASFFKPDVGTALGTLILNRELIAGPLYNRVCLGITPDKKIEMARIQLEGKLMTAGGNTVRIQNVNQPRLNKQEVILYSSRWGIWAPPTPRDGVSVQIDQNRITQVTTNHLSIPPSGYVLTGPKDLLETMLRPNDVVTTEVSTLPDWANVAYAVSGGPYLVKDGEIFVDLKQQVFRPGAFTEPAPRTAVGVTADNHLLMVTVDGRNKNVSVGMTLTEMAHLMKSLGAQEAMNFDGGSSTQMVVKNHVVNDPTVAGGAPVASALLIRELPVPLTHEVIGVESDAANGPHAGHL